MNFDEIPNILTFHMVQNLYFLVYDRIFDNFHFKIKKIQLRK